MPIQSPAARTDDGTPQTQTPAGMLGVWIFLATELMFFAPLFLGYAYCRWHFAPAFAYASRQTDFAFGTLNTALLLTSSMTMAVAVRASRDDALPLARRLLWITAALGVAFLAIKGIEYQREWREGFMPGAQFRYAGADAAGVELFFFEYFGLTLLHALHLCAGIVLVSATAVSLAAARAQQRRRWVELVGLYWHFVDLVWIFLYPLLYLINRAG